MKSAAGNNLQFTHGALFETARPLDLDQILPDLTSLVFAAGQVTEASWRQTQD